jgi:hypothetical protein
MILLCTLPMFSFMTKEINLEAEESWTAEGGETLATMTVELDLERMEKMKQEVLELVGKMVEEYASVSVMELEMALVEGLAKVREIGLKQTQTQGDNEESDVV